ncbi:class I tRNA ligase family protein, partial [Candidatus Saccharibacteria bacterium]|nr:class I tRNA ligase family protein [Candidatus Saccharibacteria bacterium]
KGKTYKRDPDVFDTWFSSGQWPFVTLNYPEGEEYNQFYPLSLMETGGEILYQWVARMVMLGLYITGDVPFKTVYIHGYVLAEDGAKMSKSLGNVINPLESIAEYGSDALRMGLLTGRRPGINQGYHPAKIKAGRNFANKLWNISRYVEDKVGEQPAQRVEPKAESIADHWILKRVNDTSEEVAKAMENYRVSEAWELVYHFIWHDLADWYIETSKIAPNLSVLTYVLEASLKLAHPFAPFLTETIWQTLQWEHGSLLAVQKWPPATEVDTAKAGNFQDILEIVSEARRINAAVKATQPTLFFRGSPVISDNSELIKRLGRLGNVLESPEDKKSGMRITKPGYDIWLDIDTGMAKTYIDKLIDQKADHTASIDKLEVRLSNPNYADKAPKQIVDETRQQLEEERLLLVQIQAEIDLFSKLIES